MKKLHLLIAVLALIFYSANPVEAAISDGLIAYYPFNGNADDATSGNGHNGVVNGAILEQDRYGNLNGAYFFDGIDDVITVPNDASLNPEHITISLWIKILEGPKCVIDYYGMICDPTSFVSKSAIPPTGANSGYIFPYMGFRYSDSFGLIVNTISDWNWDFTRSFSYSSIQNPNLWHLYTATYDGINRKVYIDGQLVSTDSQSSPGPIIPNSNDIAIGNQPGANEWAHAIMDDIRIYNRALSNEEERWPQTFEQQLSDLKWNPCC